MNRVAILGANGFIGSRIVEMFYLGGLADVRPVVRITSSLARLSRFDLDCRVADARDEKALQVAFEGCDAVIHTVAGGGDLILAALAPAYRAAQRVGVRRLIYLSSASVYGQAPAPGTDEETPQRTDQPLDYNNAKVRAERVLQQLRNQGTVELVILRPGIVVGPRSAWIGKFADALLANEAFLINGGSGICNSLYIDNLVHAIGLALKTDKIDRQAFLLGDAEQVTWKDLYLPIAEALGFNVNDLLSVPGNFATNRPSLRSRFRSSSFSQALRLALPPYLKQVGTALVFPAPTPMIQQSPWELQSKPPPEPTLEMSLLSCCQYKLPYGKASELLGYKPVVSFLEGMRRTVAWMEFAGYPIRP